MNELNEKLPAALVEFVVNYMFIVLLAAAVLVLLVLIFIICLAVNSSKHKKKMAELEEQYNQNLEHAVQEARAQGEEAAIEKIKQDGGAIVNADAELTERCNQMSAAIDDLNHDVLEKQNKIDELTAALEKAKKGGAHVVAESSRESEYAEAIEEWEKANNELEAENTELKQKYSIIEAENKRLENEIKLRVKNSDSSNDRLLNENLTLTRENAKLKTENERLAADNESLKDSGLTKNQSAPKKSAAKSASKSSVAPTVKIVTKNAAKPAAKVEPAEDDDEDEVYDEFGDENSTVKVKIKYDRDKGNWVITRSDSDRTYRRVTTKQEALSLGKDLARRLQAQLVVHKKDGKFQKV